MEVVTYVWGQFSDQEWFQQFARFIRMANVLKGRRGILTRDLDQHRGATWVLFKVF